MREEKLAIYAILLIRLRASDMLGPDSHALLEHIREVRSVYEETGHDDIGIALLLLHGRACTNLYTTPGWGGTACDPGIMCMRCGHTYA